MSNKLNKLIDEDVFDRKKNARRRPKELKDQERSDHKAESLEQNYLDKLEKKTNGAVDEVGRQINRDNEAELSLGDGLENEPVFVEEASKINKKKIRVKKKLINITAFVISGVKNDNPKKPEVNSVDVLADDKEAKEKATAELEEQITDSFTKFLYNKLGDKNKELLLDNYFADNVVLAGKSEILEMDRLSEANYNVVLFSNNGFLMQFANPEETNADIKDSKHYFNIIHPSGVEIASGLGYEEAHTQLNDLAEEYQSDAIEFFNKYYNTATSPENLIKEGDEELFGQENVDSVKKLEDLMNDYESEAAIPGQLPVIPEHIITERTTTPESTKADSENITVDEEPVLENTQEENKSDVETETNTKTQAETEEPVIEVATTVESQNYESSPLFNKFVLSRLQGVAKSELDAYLSKEDIDRQEVKAWSFKYIYGLTAFSSVGYAVYLENIDEVKDKNGVATESEKAIYSLIGPSGVKTHENLSYKDSQSLLWSESKKYLDSLNEEFENNKEAIEKELAEVETAPVVTNESLENKDSSLFNEMVLPYAEKMGIKAEQLAAHPEFLELNGAQQQFVLEALNRSSLNKIKVEAHNNFKTEEESKKWYNIGFALNKNFHKKKHEVLAAKEIHEKGLEGYGEEELAWLTSIIKNGPEINLDKEGEVESVSYLKTESGTDPKRQELINEYNKRAYYLSLSGTRDDFNKGMRADYLTTAREELLASAENDADAAELVNKLVEAEKQLKLHQFLKSDPNNEKIIQSLVDNSLGSWEKFGMMASGQGDKAKYMGVGMASRVVLRGEVSTMMLGKAFSYAVGPMVAAAMGAWRSNNRARAGLKEETELSKLGVENNNKLIKSLNLAVGSEKSEDGKTINIGLADKLENLTEKINLVESEIQQLEKTRKTKKTQEKLNSLKTEQTKLSERLIDRIEYTSQKMEKGLVSFGAPAERAANYYQLLNSLEAAKSLVFNENYILNYNDRVDKTVATKNVTDLTRSKNIKDVLENNEEFRNILAELEKIDDKDSDAYKALNLKREHLIYNQHLNELSKLSVQDRLASFLNFNEDKRKSAEFKYLVKETTKGAVMGATFAAVAAWVFETTGLGNWTSNQINHLSRFTHADQAIDWVKSVLSSNQHGGATVGKVATETAVHSSVLNHETPKTIIEDKAPNLTAAETKIPKVENSISKTTPENIISKTHTEQISSEHNSIWRSVKDMFKTNANELGYKGDINDTTALNKWSEIQTANAIDHSEGLTDKVFDGNKVILENDGGVYHVSVEQGEGLTPGHLNSAAEEIAKPNTPEVKVPEEIKVPIVETPKPVVELKAPVVESLKPNSEGLSQDSVTKEIADKWHLPIDKTQIVDATHIAYFNKEGGVLIDTAKGTIDKIATSKMVEIPKEFINEIKGRVPLDRFINRGGLDKIFSSWDKLSANDKTVYNILNSFGQNKLSPFELINKISGTFNVVATDVNINIDNNHFMLGNREFEMNLKGVDKLVKVLSRRFGA